MRLIFATVDFVICGRPYPGFPILLTDDMAGCRPVNQFFRFYLLRGAIGSKKSWANTGQALYDYFSFLQAHELAWQDVDRGESKNLIAAYRDYCFDVAELARNTVRNRLLYVCAFYEFALQQTWINQLPFGFEFRHAPRAPGLLAHVDARGSKAFVRDVIPRAHRNVPKFLSSEQAKALVQAATNPHHRMIIRLALGTGLRREELATFPLALVAVPESASRQTRNIRVSLSPRDGHGIKTKGSKPRDIYVSRRLMDDLRHYAVHVRGERAGLSTREQKALFLNQDGEPFSADGKSLDRIVRLIGQKIGLKVWPHMLRHTYATHTLVSLQRSRDRNQIEPLAFMQRQLGHASINTTMVYLHLVHDLANDAVLAYDDELNDWFKESKWETARSF